MPGIHSVVVARGQQNPATESDLITALDEPSGTLHRVASFYDSFFSISAPKGYPWTSWETDELLILIDGMIYSMGEGEIRSSLQKIGESFSRGETYKDKVRSLVETADGDFVVEIWAKAQGNLLIFNDCLARLAFYFFCDGRLGIFSRELRTPLRYMPTLRLRRSSLVENLLFQYPLGNKTFFEDLFRLEPAEMISVSSADGRLRMTRESSIDFNFCLRDPIESPSRAIPIFRDAFLASLEDRVKTLQRRSYRIIADLSGGFDTRAVLGGFSRLSLSADFYSHSLVTGDESGIAKRIFDAAGAPGKFDTVEADHGYLMAQLPPLVYRTDGLVNYHTTFACTADIRALRAKVPGTAARFGGLGGEFIRHPAKRHIGSLYRSVMMGLYSMPVAAACRIARMKVGDYADELRAYLTSYPETSIQDQLKRWYYEYYGHFVGAAAEDRERDEFWTVHPMWSLRFARTAFNKAPLEWAGYSFFISFLQTLDGRLLSVPIYGKSADLGSEGSRLQFEAAEARKDRLKRAKARAALPILLYRSVRYACSRAHRMVYAAQKERYGDFCMEYPLAEGVFDSQEARAYLSIVGADWFIYQVGTALMYFHDLKTRYPGKLQ